MQQAPSPDWFQRVHLVGVAGVGMSALAEVLVGLGCAVSGSDRFLDAGRRLGVLGKLERQGVQLFPQDGSGITSDTTAIGVSTAIEPDNPDLRAAQELGISVKHRSEFLVGLAASRRCIGIAGTSGKTTVTGMVGWVLDYAGLDPTVVNGGGVLNWQDEDHTGSARVGGSDLLVVEMDESDKSLLRFAPETAVINNMSRDHFDEAETKTLFRDFVDRVRGPVVCGAGVTAQLQEDTAWCPGELRERAWPAFAVEEDGSGSFDYAGLTFALRQPGRHNLQNAFMTVRLCELLGVPLDRIRDAFREFAGIHRRLEEVGRVSEIRVVDDYAHNPEKIRAAWETMRYGSKRVLGVWRPHGFGPLKMMLNDLVEVFEEVCRPEDRLFLLPVFYAGGTASQEVGSKDLTEMLCARGLHAEVVSDYAALKHHMLGCVKPGDTILAMGARDPDLSIFCKAIVEELRDLDYN